MNKTINYAGILVGLLKIVVIFTGLGFYGITKMQIMVFVVSIEVLLNSNLMAFVIAYNSASFVQQLVTI